MSVLSMIARRLRSAADAVHPPTRTISLTPTFELVRPEPTFAPLTPTVSLPTVPHGTRKSLQRSYSAASQSNIFAHWIASRTSGDAELRTAQPMLVARARELARNNPHMEAFLRSVEQEVVGPDGFQLQSKVTEIRKVEGKWKTMPDQQANQKIEDAWYQWVKPKHCSASGLMSFAQLMRLVMRSTARDGSCLIRIITGPTAGKFGIKLQLLEIDHLDSDRFEMLPNGNQVRFGIEFDQYGKPLSYRIFNRHPGDSAIAPVDRHRSAVTVPADQMLHFFIPRRISQCIGEPWIVSAMDSLKMLGKFEEYALIASMVGASKMGFYVNTGDGAEAPGIGVQSEGGTMVEEAIPGAFTQLPQGWDFKQFDPSQPSESNAGFAKLILQEISAGAGFAYTTLTGDLNGTSYSSGRIGLMDQREYCKTLQNAPIETVVIPIFEKFLELQMLNGNINLPFDKFDKFNAPKFHGRRWQWIDPENDAKALSIRLALGMTSRTAELNEEGKDFEEVLADLAEETDLAAEAGVTIVEKDPFQNSKNMVDSQKSTAIAPAP